MRRILVIVLVASNALAFAGIQGWLGGAAPRIEPERIGNQLDPQRIRLASDPPPPQESPAAPEAMADTSAAVADEAPPPIADAGEQTAGDGQANAIAARSANPPQQDPVGEAAAGTVPAPQQPESEPQSAATPAVADAALSCVAWSGLSQADADALTRRLRRSGAEAERSKTDTPSSWWVRIPPQGSREQAERQAQELRTLGVKDLFIVQDAGPAQYAISLGVFKTDTRARQLLNQLRAQGVRNAGVEARLSTTYRVQARVAADAVRSIESGVRGIAARRTACTPR